MRSREHLRPLTPPRPLTSPLRYRRSPIQVSALWRPVRQKVCPPYIFHLPPPHSSPFTPLFFTAISSRDTSINAIPTRNLSFLPPLLAARVPLLPAGRPPRNKPVTNVSSLLYHVMGPILVVSHSFSPPVFLSRKPFPSAKCLHKKTRCTYVKFHRQTAPVGPGHPTRFPHDSSNPAHPSLGALPQGLGSYRLSDPFLLSINGAALNPSAISNPLYTDHQFSFPPSAQVSAPSYDNSLDYSARYRAQADFLTRTGVIPQERAHPLPAIYQEPQAPHDPSNTARYAQSYHMHDDPQDYPLPPSPTGVDYGYIDNKVRVIYISSFSCSSDLQSPSPSHSQPTCLVIPPMGTTLIIRWRSSTIPKFTNAVSRVLVIRVARLAVVKLRRPHRRAFIYR